MIIMRYFEYSYVLIFLYTPHFSFLYTYKINPWSKIYRCKQIKQDLITFWRTKYHNMHITQIYRVKTVYFGGAQLFWLHKIKMNTFLGKVDLNSKNSLMCLINLTQNSMKYKSNWIRSLGQCLKFNLSHLRKINESPVQGWIQGVGLEELKPSLKIVSIRMILCQL